MSTAQLVASAPVLLVSDVVKAAEYYRDKLGFDEVTLYGAPTDFAIVRRNGFAIMLALVEPAAAPPPHWKVVKQMWNVYLWVDDVEAIYVEYQQRGAIIDYTIGMKAYGVKEFGVRDLDDHDIAVGQIIR